MTLTASGLYNWTARRNTFGTKGERDGEDSPARIYDVQGASVDFRPYLYARGVQRAAALVGLSLIVALFLLLTDRLVAFAFAAEFAAFFGAVFLALAGRYLLSRPDGSSRPLRELAER